MARLRRPSPGPISYSSSPDRAHRFTIIIAVVSALAAFGSTAATAFGLVFTKASVDATREQLALSQQGQVAERFGRAVEQLGSDKENVRLGGVYALELIMRQSEQDQPVVMEVLSAFIREHASAAPSQRDSPTPDVQASLTVLSRREHRHDGSIDLHGVHLQGAHLPRAHLARANFTGAYLYRARLDHAVLNGARFTRANLAEVNLVGAELTGADLSRAHLGGADLTGAVGVTASAWRCAIVDSRTKLPAGVDPPVRDASCG